MPLAINSSITSLSAQFNLNRTTNSLSETMTRLSTGPRINRANDSARDLAVLSSSSSYTPSTSVVGDNINDAMNKYNIVDGALSSLTDMLQRGLVLTHQSANETLSDAHLEDFNAEMSRITKVMASIAQASTFNGEILFDSSGTTPGIKSYVTSVDKGGNASTVEFDTSKVALYSSTNAADGILTRSYGGYHLVTTDSTPTSSKAIDLTAASTVEERAAMVQAFKGMLDDVNAARTYTGAVQSQLNDGYINLARSSLPSASRYIDISGTDEAINLATLAVSQIRQQSVADILSQANSMPQIALSLLR